MLDVPYALNGLLKELICCRGVHFCVLCKDHAIARVQPRPAITHKYLFVMVWHFHFYIVYTLFPTSGVHNYRILAPSARNAPFWQWACAPCWLVSLLLLVCKEIYKYHNFKTKFYMLFHNMVFMNKCERFEQQFYA